MKRTLVMPFEPPPVRLSFGMLETAAATPVLPGEILAGKYRIERLLGEGAMGTVVAARHLLLEQHVAIKFLRPELAQDPAVSERFRREGKAAARIKGEHVVRVFDVGELESGLPYLVMEYVEGMNLAEVIAAEGALPLAAAVDYILQACDALAQAHASGIVHRDVKPSNLFVSHRPDGRPLVKVLDFGISKVSGAEGAMTHPTVLMGSPLYMSPEQLLSSRDVDGRSDIWSLGIVLYELLTGALPFVGDTIPQICVQIQDAPAPSPRKLRPEVPAGLEAVVLRCLEKNPALRYATILELVTALKPGADAGKHLHGGTGTRHYDGGVPSSLIGAGSQRARAAGGAQRLSRRTFRTLVVASAVMMAAAATAGLISLSRANREIISSPLPTVRVEPPAAVPVSPSLQPVSPPPSPAPAPSPTVAKGLDEVPPVPAALPPPLPAAPPSPRLPPFTRCAGRSPSVRGPRCLEREREGESERIAECRPGRGRFPTACFAAGSPAGSSRAPWRLKIGGARARARPRTGEAFRPRKSRPRCLSHGGTSVAAVSVASMDLRPEQRKPPPGRGSQSGAGWHHRGPVPGRAGVGQGSDGAPHRRS